MNVTEWMADFKALHEAARKGGMSDDKKKLYMAAREQLAKSLAAAQGLTVREGETARQTFRVAQAYQIELSLHPDSVKTATLDISRGGFSIVLGQPPDPNEAIGFTLRLSAGTDPIVGRAKLINTVRQPGRVRCSMAFVKLSAADQERLEHALFDAVLARVGV